ncbi:efflux RND transporter periplasmic adaptor subunit [Saccharicrinis sp. FJH54]|uniref:efflux RND transporter periplasmic adaptor subunit n=1 Tax=Saccharicrinis sp. FJH54 TaxID=3344665 RepID=UPI0035D3F9D1
MKSHFILSILLFSTVLFSCQNKSAETEEAPSDLIQITKAQFDSEKMALGAPELSSFSDMVYFTGTIIPTINGKAQISLPVPGIISKIYGKPGMETAKGTVLLEVTGNALFDLQKDYAESSALLRRLKSDYERTKELRDENIGTKKEFVLAESNFMGERARLNALKMKLEKIGLDTDKIENGNFYTAYTLKSPIKGYITSIIATVGQYIEPQQTIAEIINPETFQIKLSVFEKDINKLKPGQTIEFYSAGNKSTRYSARLATVGKAIMSDTRSIECFADIDPSGSSEFVNDQFVEGNVVVNSEMLLSVPETAVLFSGNDAYILTYENETPDNYFFSKARIKTGRKTDRFIELTEAPKSDKILVTGVYNLAID